MKKTLKSMSIAECSSERSRHRVHIGHLVLLRMRPDHPAAEVASIDADILKRRRRIARLDRQIKQIEDFKDWFESGWQPIPYASPPELDDFRL